MLNIVVVFPKKEIVLKMKNVLIKNGFDVSALPLKAYDLVDTVSDLLTDIHRRLKREREKPNKRSSADQGVINQAKSLLMEKNGLTEEEAHRYLQKRSMDNGTNMVETAYMVLQVF